jgi:hypothetical protein
MTELDHPSYSLKIGEIPSYSKSDQTFGGQWFDFGYSLFFFWRRNGAKLGDCLKNISFHLKTNTK